MADCPRFPLTRAHARTSANAGTRHTRHPPPGDLVNRDHLAQLLVDRGAITEGGISRRARLRRCPCGLPVLAGLDDDIAALEAACDPARVSRHGEALALLDARRTYELRADGKLRARDRHAIARRPAGPERTVLAAHRCPTGIPSSWQQEAPPPVTVEEGCPF